METVLDADLISVADAATLLKVNRSTIRRWIDQGTLPAYRIGQRRVRIRRADLATVIAPVQPGAEQAEPTGAEEKLAPRRLTPEEQERALMAVERARALQAEILAQRGGQLFTPSSGELLNELRDERTRQLDDLR